jgi:hypothetical protein
MPYSYRRPYATAGSAPVAIESMKHAARRPSPPLPSPASGSSSRRAIQSRLLPAAACSMGESSRRFMTLLASERPMRNSMDR